MIEIGNRVVDEIKIKPNQNELILDKFVNEENPVDHTTKITLGENSKVTYFVVITDSSQVNKTIEVNLIGKGSEAKILGVYFGTNADKYHFRVVSNHEGSNTRALTWINGVIADRSESNFDGLVKIIPDISAVNSYLANHVLVLGEEAKANAIPSLEIESNDVKCSHEATVGQIDEAQIFYLMSRGIKRAEAEELLKQGFFEAVISKIDNKEFQQKVRDAIRICD